MNISAPIYYVDLADLYVPTAWKDALRVIFREAAELGLGELDDSGHVFTIADGREEQALAYLDGRRRQFVELPLLGGVR